MPADPSIQRKLWRVCAVLVLAIPGFWHTLSLPPTLGQVLRMPMLDWLNLPWLTSLTLLALLGHRFGWWPQQAAMHPAAEPENASADARVQNFSMAYRMLPDAAGITRIADGQFLDVNPALCDLLGLHHADIVGKTNYELQIYASDAERPRLLQQLQLHQSVDRMPIAIQTARQNGTVHGLISARTITLGDELCMMFVFHDTTEQTQTYQTLQAVNGLLQQAGHLALLGVWEDTKGAGLVYWSDVCYDIHGLARDTPLPRSYIQTFVAPAWRSVMRDKIKHCLRNKSSWDADIEIVRADGRTAWMRSRGEVVLDAHGEVTGLRGIMQDVDAAKRLQESLRQSEVRFEHIFEMVSTPMALVGCQDGRFQTVNTAWETLFGFSRYECAGQTAAGLGLTTSSGLEALLQASPSEDATLLNQELLLRTRKGQSITVLYSQRRTNFGDTDVWLISIQDITAHKAEQERLKESEALISLTLSAAALGRWDWNLATGMVSGDAQWRSLQGIEQDCAPPSMGGRHARHWTELLSPVDLPHITQELQRHTETPSNAAFDVTWRTAESEPTRWLRSTGQVVELDVQGKPVRMLGVTQDVTHQHEKTSMLEQMAHCDALTGLANRLQLTARLKESTRAASMDAGQLGVVYIDLDGFKPVNDRLGHAYGDKLLVQVAKRLKQALRADDCVARIGGDEFVILLNGLESRTHCETLLERIMLRLSTSYALGNETACVTASMGYTLYPEDDADEDTLLRHADQAMYLAKQAGRNCIRAFDAATDRQQRDQQAHTARISEGLAQGEFTLFLQPKIDTASRQLVGVEGLARWHHPERGLLQPGAFIPQVEGSALDIPFGQWALEQAIHTIAQLQRAGLDVPVGVNISPRHLQQTGFARWLIAALEARPEVAPRLLDLEITESAALQDITHVAKELELLRAIGVTISLDDFGTGYSSLTYLRQLPLDTLKIDQSFVRDMLRDQSNRTIIRGVTGLAASFGYDVIAEGVETWEQCQMLEKVGCTVAQGYFFARPMPAEQLPGWYTQWCSTTHRTASIPLH